MQVIAQELRLQVSEEDLRNLAEDKREPEARRESQGAIAARSTCCADRRCGRMCCDLGKKITFCC